MAWSENYNSSILIRASKNRHLRGDKAHRERQRDFYFGEFGLLCKYLQHLAALLVEK